MNSQWTKAERTVLEKLTLAAFAQHLTDGLSYGDYTLEEAGRYWESAKGDPGTFAETASLPGNGTIVQAWDLITDYERIVERLEFRLQPALEVAAREAVDNESLTATAEEREQFIHLRKAYDNAASYADQAGLTLSQLRSAISYYYGYDRRSDLFEQREIRRAKSKR